MSAAPHWPHWTSYLGLFTPAESKEFEKHALEVQEDELHAVILILLDDPEVGLVRHIPAEDHMLAGALKAVSQLHQRTLRHEGFESFEKQRNAWSQARANATSQANISRGRLRCLPKREADKETALRQRICIAEVLAFAAHHNQFNTAVAQGVMQGLRDFHKLSGTEKSAFEAVKQQLRTKIAAIYAANNAAHAA